MRITDEHYAHWLQHGYVIVRDFLTPDEVAAARENIHTHYMPTAEEYVAGPEKFRKIERGLMHNNFPFRGDALNDVCTHPEIVAFMERAIGTRDIALSHSTLVGKYAGAGDFDQRLHVDFGNNTLVYPMADGVIRDIPTILYYSDVTAEHGPTCVLSQEHSRDLSLSPWSKSRDEFPHLYEQEEAVVVSAGSILIYGMRTWHRGSAFRAKEGARFSHHFGYRAAGYDFMGQKIYNHDGGRPELDRFIERVTPRQREVIGFPAPGHPYWDEDTLAGVAARYPGLDLTPYREASGR
jgi:ectoine hydroxylase-related dioxygenase (phytanoyl-CoA dioxygenase family)